MAERRAAESLRPLRSASPAEQVEGDSPLPQSVSAPRQAVRNRRPSPSVSPPRQIARFARSGDSPRLHILPASQSVPSPQHTAARPRASASVSPPRNAALSDRGSESPSVRGQQTSRSDVVEQRVVLRRLETRSGLTQQQQAAHSAEGGRSLGRSLGFNGAHASPGGPTQQETASPSRRRQIQPTHGAQAGHSASSQQQPTGSAGGGDRSGVGNSPGTRNTSAVGLPLQTVAPRGAETPYRNLGSRSRITENQGTGSLGGRPGLHHQSLTGLPERGIITGQRMTHHTDHIPGGPYTRAETISRTPNNSGLTEQEQRRAKKLHRYYSRITTGIMLGPKTDSKHGALAPAVTAYEFTANLVSKHNTELPRGWPEMKLVASTLDDALDHILDDAFNNILDDDSIGEAWLLALAGHHGPPCESFPKDFM